jgi:hypothetical protein
MFLFNLCKAKVLLCYCFLSVLFAFFVDVFKHIYFKI